MIKNIIEFFTPTKLAVIGTLGVLLAIWGYGQWQRWDAGARVKDGVKIETQASEIETRHEDGATRKVQNEIIVRDISPAEFDRVLEKHRY